MIRIILADDHQLFTEGINALFENDNEVQVVGIYHTGLTLLNEVEQLDAHVLLLDVKMGHPDGLMILTKLVKMSLPLKVVMLSTFSDQPTIMECKKRGAHGYLLKNTSREELKTTINKVIEGDFVFDLLNTIQNNEDEKFRYCRENYKLTKREWEILLLIKKQFTNQMISESLHLSIYTVETHRKNLMQKLGLKSPVGLFQFIQLHEI